MPGIDSSSLESEFVFSGSCSTGSGRIESTSAVDGIRFYCSGGTIDSGIFKLYGVS